MKNFLRQTQSIVNGVIGDALQQRKSRLAIPMTFANTRHQEGNRVCILAHGSCGSELNWRFKNDPAKDYGTLLQADFGFVPFYLRYNSGLHISTNGKQLSDLLEHLVGTSPTKITEMVLIGHSMGGLIFRSACFYAAKKKLRWISLVTRIFYLGSPHFGTHFEKFGKLTTTVLRLIPTAPTRALAAFIDLRSEGIKDLRHGYIIDEDWQGKNADDLFYVHENRTPLLKTAEHYLICGTISKVKGSKIGRLFGDGMVHPGSGTGQGFLPWSRIPFKKEHNKIFHGIAHHNLDKSQKIYNHIKKVFEENGDISIIPNS